MTNRLGLHLCPAKFLPRLVNFLFLTSSLSAISLEFIKKTVQRYTLQRIHSTFGKNSCFQSEIRLKVNSDIQFILTHPPFRSIQVRKNVTVSNNFGSKVLGNYRQPQPEEKGNYTQYSRNIYCARCSMNTNEGTAVVLCFVCRFDD